MSEPGGSEFQYTEVADSQRALSWLTQAPPEFWTEDHPAVDRTKTIALAEAFVAGANFPFQFNFNGDALSVNPASPQVKAFDAAESPQIASLKRVHKQTDALVKQGKRKEIATLVDANLGVVGSQFKLHLQPGRANLHRVVTELARFMSQPDIQQLIYNMKMLDSEADFIPELPDSTGGYNPQIVIYPYSGEEKAQQLVRKATAHFANGGGSGLTPGYNVKISDLLFLAQSDRGFKINLARIGLLDRYFDRNTNFGLLKGESRHWQGVLPNVHSSLYDRIRSFRQR